MTRIPPPAWAPSYAQHRIETLGNLGNTARIVITPLLPRIYAELDRRINAFANDPNRCFQDASEGFPQHERLDGCYYLGSETYEGNSEETFFRLWLMVRCLEKPWHPNQELEGYDYLGLEAIITVDRQGAAFAFDEEFNTSSI